MASVRVPLISDTHLGFDDPIRPRVQRRRRGPDFFDHYMKALEPALNGKVDCVVHGGDLFYRSRIPDSLISRAFAPLLEIADQGVPILIVPGNHERSKIRQGLLEMHSGIQIFHKPDTFRTDNDTINPHQIPDGFDVVLSGHIHRHQFLQSDHAGQKLKVPVLFAGATTRTAFDKRREVKGYCRLMFSRMDDTNQWHYAFEELPCRPMYVLNETNPYQIGSEGRSITELQRILTQKLSGLPNDAVVKIRFNPPPGELPAISLAEIRRLAPETMSIEVTGFRNRTPNDPRLP